MLTFKSTPGAALEVGLRSLVGSSSWKALLGLRWEEISFSGELNGLEILVGHSFS